MKPVAVFQHCNNVTPGHFASFLDARAIPWQLISVDQGDQVPPRIDDFSGLCFMGGPMSVNDDLGWIEQECALIRNAVSANMPVIGHCLGGQLMSRALGGTVGRNPVPEIGWGRVSIENEQVARTWLGECKGFEAYHWHGETFSLPQGAQRILRSRFCENQAFVLGPHLGMQFHVEMTESLIRNWNEEWSATFDASTETSPSVQPTAQQLVRMAESLPVMRNVADRLYAKWVQGLLVG